MTSAQASAKLASLAGDSRLAFLRNVRSSLPAAEFFIVGGAVRDALLGREPKDIDLVVRHVPLEELTSALEQLGSVSLVGRDFGVLKFQAHGSEAEIDIAWPRTERAGMSGGYRDFAVQADADLPIESDLARRDFSLNAMALRLDDAKLIDPHDGLRDLEAKRIRAVGDPSVRFAEDFSRMLRAIRFACQLDFEIEAETWQALCRLITRLNDVRDIDGRSESVVPQETMAKELVRSYAADPVRATSLLERSGALFLLIPELAPLSSCAQPADHHSEGDVWAHTVMALGELRGTEFAALFPGEQADAETALAVLLHDVGKPQTAEVRQGRLTFYGHDVVGSDIALAVAQRLKLASAGVDPERLAWLVRHHLFPNMVDLGKVRRVTLERYFLYESAAGRRLLHLACADAAGRRPESGKPDLSNLGRLLDTLATISDAKGERVPPLLSGEELMKLLDIGPGPDVGELLEALREAQLHGEVRTKDEAKTFLLKKKGP